MQQQYDNVNLTNFVPTPIFRVSKTNSVQVFIRAAMFVGTFGFLLLLEYLFSGGSLGLSSPILPVLIFINFVISAMVSKMFYVLPEWERMVLLRLGKFDSVKPSGFFIVPPFIYSVASILDTRIEIRQVEATNTLTSDNVPIKVTAAVEYKVEDPRKATVDVKDYRQSVIWLATEALKNTIGSMDLKQLLNEREQIAASLKEQIDRGAVVYGVDVRAVRITDIDTPTSLIEELAVIARAKRAAEAKKIQAEAEILVASKIAEATRILNEEQGSIRLRELQVLNEMSKEESAMIIVYPYGDRHGKDIANAAAGRIK